MAFGIYFMVDVEQAFQIEIPEREWFELHTPRAVMDYMISRVPNEDRNVLEEQIRDLIRTKLKVDGFKDDSEFDFND